MPNFLASWQPSERRDAGAAERTGLENRSGGNSTGGSNPPLSAKLMKVIKRSDFFPVFLFYRVRADSVDEGSIGKLGDSVSKSV